MVYETIAVFEMSVNNRQPRERLYEGMRDPTRFAGGLWYPPTVDFPDLAKIAGLNGTGVKTDCDWITGQASGCFSDAQMGSRVWSLFLADSCLRDVNGHELLGYPQTHSK